MTYMQSQQGKQTHAESTSFPNLRWNFALCTSSSGMQKPFIPSYWAQSPTLHSCHIIDKNHHCQAAVAHPQSLTPSSCPVCIQYLPARPSAPCGLRSAAEEESRPPLPRCSALFPPPRCCCCCCCCCCCWPLWFLLESLCRPLMRFMSSMMRSGSGPSPCSLCRALSIRWSLTCTCRQQPICQKLLCHS